MRGIRALVLALCWVIAGAASATDYLQAGKDFGSQASSGMSDNINDNTVQQSVPQYQGTDLPQTQYANNPGSIDQDAVGAVDDSPANQFAWDKAHDQKQLPSINDPILTHAQAISDGAEEGQVAGGSSTYSDCKSVAVDTGTSETHQCEVWPQPVQTSCSKDLSVDVKVDNSEQVIEGQLYLGARSGGAHWLVQDYIGMNVTDGTLMSAPLGIDYFVQNYNQWNPLVVGRLDGNDVTMWSDPSETSIGKTISDLTALGYSWADTELVGGAVFNVTPYKTFDALWLYKDHMTGCTLAELPTPNNNYLAKVQLQWFSPNRVIACYMDFKIHFAKAPVVTKSWTDSCTGYSARSDCQLDSGPTCTEGAGTRNVNGISVYSDCWKYESTYSCAGGTPQPEAYCQELEDQGCYQISQSCDDTGACTRTYQCDSGDTQQQLDCTSAYDLGNMKFDTSYTESTEFADAASKMEIMDAIANDSTLAGCSKDPVTGQTTCGNISIFKGEGLHCMKTMGSDCCADSGWAVSNSLSSCSATEKKLGLAKEAGKCHYVGRYCDKKYPVTGCVRTAYTYCCYNSKLARIIQEQGVHGQLGIDWGTSKNPNCGGITQEQLKQLDFAKMDFSEFYQDVTNNINGQPDSGAVTQTVQDYMSRLQNSGCSQYDTNCMQSQ